MWQNSQQYGDLIPWLLVNHFTRELERKGLNASKTNWMRRTPRPFYVREHSTGENIFPKNMTTASDILSVRIN